MTTVSIVIVNYNVRQFLTQCIDSILKSASLDFELEIIVVDNASIDGSQDYLANHYPDVKLISNKNNVGFSKANNQGIKVAKGNFILILNPDTIIQEDTITSCLDYMKRNENAGVIGVKMVDGSGKYLRESKRGEPTFWNSFTKFSGLTHLFPYSKIFSGYYLGHLDENITHKVDVLCGAFMFFRKNVLIEAGCFDEDYFMYGEDIDLSLKVWKKNYEVIYLPATKIIHFKGESTKKTSYSYIKNFYNAMKIFVNKNYKGTHGFLMSSFLTMVIFVIGVIAYIKNLAKNNLRLLIDAALILFGTQFFKEMWATHYFKNPSYFNNLASYYNNIGIVIIYSTFLYFFGQYDNYWRLKRLFFAVLISFVVSSIIYAMLPLHLRSSRILLVISASLSFFIPLLTLKLFDFINYKIGGANVSGNYLIVAYKANAEKIISLINTYDVKNNILGFINPQNKVSDDFYINSIQNLSIVAKTIKANKIVLCTDDLDNQTLLEAMVLPDSDIKYLIVNISNLSVLDSNDKNKAGIIFINQSTYKLSQKLYIRLKRLGDIIFSILSIFLFPILILFNISKVLTLKKLFSILRGKISWVGYSIQEKDKIVDNNLPLIKPSIITTNYMVNNATYFPLIRSDHEADIHYAKNYNLLTDVDIIFNFIFKR